MSKEKSMILMRQIQFLTSITRRGSHRPPQELPPPPDGGPFPPPPPPDRFPMRSGHLLHLLEKESGVSQTHLAEMMDIRPQSLSEMLCRLEGEGLLERRVSESDKRSSQVYITEKGRRVSREMRARHEQFAQEFFSVLTDAEQETLSALLEKVIQSKEPPRA